LPGHKKPLKRTNILVEPVGLPVRSRKVVESPPKNPPSERLWSFMLQASSNMDKSQGTCDAKVIGGKLKQYNLPFH